MARLNKNDVMRAVSQFSGPKDAYAYLCSDSMWKRLVIENRTSDPVSPAVGQLWLRTDL